MPLVRAATPTVAIGMAQLGTSSLLIPLVQIENAAPVVKVPTEISPMPTSKPAMPVGGGAARTEPGLTAKLRQAAKVAVSKRRIESTGINPSPGLQR